MTVPENYIDYLLRINEKFDAIPYNQLPENARFARLFADAQMAFSKGETIATRFIGAGERFIRAAKLAGINVERKEV